MGRFGDLWTAGRSAATKQSAGQILAQDYLQFSDESVGQDQGPMLERIYTPPELANLSVPDLSSYSRQILESLKSRRGEETGRWLTDIASNSLVNSLEPPLAQGNSAFNEQVVWIDALFGQFIELAFEFNLSAAGTELLVSCTDPDFHGIRSDKVWDHPLKMIYEGRITTRTWALLVRAREGKISIFLLPSVKVLAFELDQLGTSENLPFMEVLSSTTNGKTCWSIGGKVVQLETIPLLARELFGDLIRVASGVMSESELFASHTDSPVLGKNLAIGFQREETDAIASPVVTSVDHQNLDQIKISDACDLVDDLIERELKKLYDEAAKLMPDAAEIGGMRRRISAVESFRTKVLEAFEHFTREEHGLGPLPTRMPKVAVHPRK